MIKRSILFLLGIILFLMGLLLTPTPVPGTTLSMAFGLVLLISTSDRALHIVAALRRRFLFVNRLISWLEERSRKRMGAVLRKTRP